MVVVAGAAELACGSRGVACCGDAVALLTVAGDVDVDVIGLVVVGVDSVLSTPPENIESGRVVGHRHSSAVPEHVPILPDAVH